MPIRIPVTFDASSGDLEKTIGDRIGGGLKKGAKVAATGVAAVLGTALFKGFGRLTAIDDAEAKLRGLGLTAGDITKVMQSATDAVTGTAFGLDEAATAAASALASGIEPGQELTKYLTLIGDAATQGGASFNDMAAIINKTTARGKVGMENLNQLSERGIGIMGWLADEYGVTGEELAKMVSRGEVDLKTFQKVLNDNIGGAAQRSGETFRGSLANVGAALGRLGARILGPAFRQLPTLFMGLQGSLDSLAPAADRVGRVLGRGLSGAVRVVSRLFGAFNQGGGPGFFERVSDAVRRFGVAFQVDVLPVLRQVGQYLVSTVLPVFRQWGKVLVTNVLPAVGSVARFLFTQLLPAIVGVWRNVAENLRPVFEAVVDVLKRDVIPTVTSLVKTFQSNEPAIQNVVLAVTGLIGKVYGLASAVLGALLPPIIRFAGFLIRTVVPAVARVIGVVVQLVAAAVRAGQAVGRFVSRVATGVADVVRFIGGLPGKITRIAGDFLDAGLTLGRNVIDGIGRGLRTAGGFISDLAKSIKNAINDALRLPFTIKGPGPLPDFTIPAFAGGTRFAPGGLALVGERGPELVNLPRGSRVRTAAQTRDALGAGVVGGGVVNVVQNNYGPATGRERLRELEWTMKYATRARGVEAGVA